MKVILMLGGGGSLGAFSCGVWKALAPLLRARGARLIGVGGASIGAINGGFIARSGQDFEAGAAALEAAWIGDLQTPSLPFTGLLAGRGAASWDGVLTGLLVGNRTLYHVDPPHWSPFGEQARVRRPLMDRSGMWRWLEETLGALPPAGGEDPLMCVPALDMASGALRLFDNSEAALGTEHFAASSAIPLVFDPVDVEGRPHWDGDVTREAALPLVLARLRDTGRLGGAPAGGDGAVRGARGTAGEGDDTTLLITVDHMSRARPVLPVSGLEVAFRAMELLLHGKMVLPEAALAGVSHVLHIVREPLPHDPVSGQFDYSPTRVGELVEQGIAQASAAWEAGPVALAAGSGR